MYAGRVVERAPTATLFANVKMPYTEALLQSIPALDARAAHSSAGDPGTPARPRRPADGLPVRAALPLRPRALPRRGTAARPRRDAGPPLRLLVPGRLARVPDVAVVPMERTCDASAR